MALRPLRSQDECDWALELIDRFMMQVTLTEEEEDYLGVLSLIVDDWLGERPSTPLPEPELLQFLMEDRNLTQQDVARGSGVNAASLNNALMGRKKLSRANIERLASYFKIGPEEFFADGLGCS